MLVALLAALGSGSVVVTASTPHYVPQGPKFDWDTLPVFCESPPRLPRLCTISMWPMFDSVLWAGVSPSLFGSATAPAAVAGHRDMYTDPHS